MLYVADTHSLAWFFSGDSKLGKNASKILQEADEGKHIIIVPTIVLAELLYIYEKRNVGIRFKDILNKINSSLNYIPYNLDIKTLIRIQNLVKINELHDRIIVAVTQMTKTKLLTKDEKITNSGYVECIW